MKKFLSAILALTAGLALCLPALAVRTDIPVQTPGKLLSGAPGATTLDLPMTAVDVANGNSCTFTGNEVLVVTNTDSTNPYTVTVTSVADAVLGRTADIATYSLAHGVISWIGPLPTTGFQQASGKLYFTGSNAAIKVCPVKILGSKIYQ